MNNTLTALRKCCEFHHQSCDNVVHCNYSGLVAMYRRHGKIHWAKLSQYQSH